ALARRIAAIVSEEAGTTRDVIEVRLDLAGVPVIVSDTAGIRETEGSIEREGIRRSLAAARDAHLNLWLSETGFDSPPSEISRETILYVRTKADLESIESTPGLSPVQAELGCAKLAGGEVMRISNKTGAGLDLLLQRIAGAAAAATAAGAGSQPALTRFRHRRALEECLASLTAFQSGDPMAPELRAEDLRQAAHALGRITGRVDVEDVLGEIFGRFCIGK
ncbi:MAG: GTPase, partial [Hyphomicrobium sp.]